MTNLLKFVKEITNSIKEDQSVTQGEIPWPISKFGQHTFLSLS